VSERTLQYAFREVMGMTPVAYLSRLRLHRVRHALRTATQASTTVTTEALRWGFWHFGDFSRAYKDCFGELPSDTLRRKPHASFKLGIGMHLNLPSRIISTARRSVGGPETRRKRTHK